MKISVIGLGAYSLAISLKLAQKNNEIYIWTESIDKEKEFQKEKKVKSIFDITLPKNIHISASMEEVIKDTSLIYIITASKYVDACCKSMLPFYKKSIPICIASKGIEESTQALLSDVVKSTLKTKNIAVISGPTFAIDIINGEPIALALASTSNKARNYVLKTLASDTLKLRISKDIIGIQLCGAVKNVIAIASGIITGLGYSDSTTAFLINESLHDIKDIIYYLGGNPKTILSFAGIGDLMLTCTSKKSRNFSLGYVIGSTKSQEKIKDYLNKNTVEGYDTLNIVNNILKRKHINIELIDVIYDIVYNYEDPDTLSRFLIEKK